MLPGVWAWKSKRLEPSKVCYSVNTQVNIFVLVHKNRVFTAVNVPGKKINVIAVMMRISVLSRRVHIATFLDSSAIFLDASAIMRF